MADIATAGEPRKMMVQVYSPQQACRHAKITEHQLRAWQRQQLFPKAPHFTYRDVLTLRALAAWKEAGLGGAKLRRAISWLTTVFAEIESPLEEVRILRRGKRLVAKLPAIEVELWSGQTTFSFDALPAAVMLAQRNPESNARRQRAEAEIWFQRGLDLEAQNAAIPSIIEAYKKAAELDPQSAGALVNLGTIYFNQHNWKEAERHYSKALTADPEYALAHFNLANLYDERGDRRKAFEHYESAIRLKPGYADAHYNVALLYQTSGQVMKAVKHWRQYLKLDPASNWAAIARRELKKLQDGMLAGQREPSSEEGSAGKGASAG